MSAAAQRDTAPASMALVRAVNRMRAAGFLLTVDGARLMVAPLSRLTDPQRAWLRAQNDALVALLTPPAIPAERLSCYRRLENLPEKPCPACGGGHFYLLDDGDGWRCSHCQPMPLATLEDLPRAAALWANRDTCCVPPRAEPEPVTCKGCAHYVPDAIGNGGGIGECLKGKPRRYPGEPHTCPQFDSLPLKVNKP